LRVEAGCYGGGEGEIVSTASATALDLTLREAAQADLADVLSLYAQPSLDDGRTLALEDARAVLSRFARYPDYRLFVACIQHKVVGTYALLIMDNLAHQGAKSAVVEDVVVARALQGQGIGRAMMRHAMECARHARCYKLTLSSNLKRAAAHAFYESLGFTRHGYSFLIELQDE
jgi:GNAT superfamily N-acetyltransferase